MSKKVKYLAFFFVFIFFVSCSLDKKSVIWTGSKEEKKRISELEIKQQQKIDIIKIYSSENIYTKEVSSTKSINLTKPIKNLSWEMSGLNLQNFIGNMYLPTIDNQFLKKKVGKNKFSILKIASSPLISGDNIIFGDDTGTIFNINKNGKIKWKKNVYKKVYKKIYKNLTFFIYKNKIYISDNIGFIYSIDLYNGKLIWIKNHGIPVKSKIKVFGDKIFIINQDNRLLCLDLKDGSIIWDLRSISTFIKSQHLLGLTISKEGEIIILTSSSDLIKIDSNSGGIYWSLNIAGTTSPSATDFFKSSDIVINNNDVIFSTSSSIFSFNLNTGYLNWSKNIYSTNTPIIDGNYIFSVTNNGYFVNIDRKSGDIIWSTNILKILKKKKQNTTVTGFVLGSGKIYATTKNGYLIIASANSGKVESFKKIGDPIYAPPIIHDGAIFILTQNSKIFGLN